MAPGFVGFKSYLSGLSACYELGDGELAAAACCVHFLDVDDPWGQRELPDFITDFRREANKLVEFSI